MSRYSFDRDDQRYWIGWDPVVASYYAQVEPLAWDREQDDDLISDVVPGDRPGQVPTLAALTTELHKQTRGLVDIPAPVREQLADDGPADPAQMAAAARQHLEHSRSVIVAAFPSPPSKTRPAQDPGYRSSTRQRPADRDHTPER